MRLWDVPPTLSDTVAIASYTTSAPERHPQKGRIHI